MKRENLYSGIFLGLTLLVCLLHYGCEDVIEVEVPTEPPRLVVEGLIRVDITQQFAPVEIQLTQTAQFFGTIEPVTDATNVVIVLQELENGAPTGATSTSSLTQLEPGSGIYVPDPSFDEDQRIAVSTITENDILFTLVIEWRDRFYAAQTQYSPTVPIDELRQGDQTLFEEDETEVVVEFTDDPDVDNYYVFDFGFGNYLPSLDTFYQGQEFSFSYFYDEALDPGTQLTVGILGADLEFFNYMSQLTTQAELGDSPFQVPAATVRGNVFDVTDIDNIEDFDNADQPEVFPLGFFAIVQEYTATIIIE